ncbi:MAG: tetratricopeptide repeat protein [Actinomyces graevenitzii]|nr:tetratricopeptide repeat protein [Actinomyces graevenitzii]
MAQRFDDSRSGGDNRNQGRGGDRHGADRRRRDDAPRNRSGARDYRSEGQRGHYRNNDERSHDRRHDGERYGERSNARYGERRDGGRNWRDGERREDRPRREEGRRDERNWGDRPRREERGWQERGHERRRDGERREERNWRDGERREERPRREGDRRDERPRRDGERSDFRRGQGRGGNRNGRFDRDRLRGERRNSRPPQRNRVPEPELPEDVSAKDLDSTARMGLRALSRLNAENIARHLVMTQRLLDTDPEVAYAHARYAASHAGRIAIVREAAGIAAYVAGLYSEALRELRAARRLSGMDTMYRAMEVDCERALGRPDAALRSAQNALQLDLEDDERAELAIVVTGIYHDQGNDELALITIEDAIRKAPKDTETLRRLHSVRADRLEDLGRVREAEAIRERIYVPEEPEVELYDIEEESAPELAEIARQLEEQSQAEAAERRREAEKLEAARQEGSADGAAADSEAVDSAVGSETDDVVDTVQDAADEDAAATDEEEPEVVAEESEPEATEAADNAEGDVVDPIAAEVEDVIEGRSK